MKRFTALAISLAAAACAAPPALIPIDNSRTLGISKDEAWANAVEYFATGNITIRTIERDSGIIYAERMFGSGNEVAQFADCGTAGMSVPTSTTVDLNVFVREAGDGVNVTVNTRFSQQRQSAWDNSISSVECSSLGVIENRILDAVAGR